MVETTINNKMMKQALKQLNPVESVKVLREILTSVDAVWDNQKQMAPAIVSLWDRVEYMDSKLNYIIELIQRKHREDKLSYDEFLQEKPKPHIDMRMTE